MKLSDQEIERDVAFAIEAAREAGRRGLGLRAEKRWEGKMLADIGDQAADGFLQGFIRGRYPQDGILSEETVDSAERLSKTRTWIVDPLDGTQEFSELRADWAVHVALTVGGRCALAAVALPADDDVLWGVCVPGQSRAGSTKGSTLALGSSAQPARPRIAVSRSHAPPWVEKFARALDGVLVPCGSAGYKVSRLLAGEADIYAHTVGLKEWDTCAPESVARALGWHVSKLRGEEHVYNQKNPKNHELLVCRPAWKERLLAALKDSGALEPMPERVKK
ncbi:MAG: 3'(2'),5'-bisphosphate nucleotidase CysQ [Planctomycetes bacterium]|nr:3'(2'),5'-bisphosphate nucleotidase CysQ [Planctomycetota bacterium]